MQEQEGEDTLGISISDVMEVIETEVWSTTPMERNGVGVGVGVGVPQVRIVEQPASRAQRFRYECEGRSAGSIPGEHSTPENKTYPTIQIVNYTGRAMVLVSCVTKEEPCRPHPHNLVGREGCKNGVCTAEVNTETMTATFANLGIQCVKKKDIEAALRQRERLRIDPFKTGFDHKSQAGGIDLNVVRLCFQVFLEGPMPNEFKRPISPVVSEPIYDKKAMTDLVICKLSECSAPVAGGKEIILLCEKVAKEDISVRLFEEHSGQVVWEGYGDFTPTQVHKQVAISFRTPRYKNLQVDYPVQVLIQLRRPSDGATSDPLMFQLTPLDADPRRKKAKIPTTVNSQDLFIHLQESENYLRAQKGGDASQVKLEPIEPGLTMLVPSPAPHAYPSPAVSPAGASAAGVAIGGGMEYLAYPAPTPVYPTPNPTYNPNPQAQMGLEDPLAERLRLLSPVGVQESNDLSGRAGGECQNQSASFGTDSRIEQLNSGELVEYIANMDPSSLSHNLSASLTFD